jgi:hypothetical protein
MIHLQYKYCQRKEEEVTPQASVSDQNMDTLSAAVIQGNDQIDETENQEETQIIDITSSHNLTPPTSKISKIPTSNGVIRSRA